MRIIHDDHGMPTPHKEIKFPLRVGKIPGTEWYGILDADDIEVHFWEMPDFFVHAANWIRQTSDIVERVQFGDASDMCFVVDDATELWSEMKKSCQPSERNKGKPND